MRMRGLRTVVVGREPASDYRAEIAKSMEAEYVCVANMSLLDLPKIVGGIDLAIEATGVSAIVFNSMQILAPNGVLCLLSVTGGLNTSQEPIDVINQALVLRNNVVLGSVNANPRHFKMGVDHFVLFEMKYPGVLLKLITNRLPWTDFHSWFSERGSGVKSTLEIAAAQSARAQKAS
jgi:glucose 1-dehydrogenase